MVAWKLKCSLSGDRWKFLVNMGPLRTRSLPQRSARRRALAPLAVTDGNSKLTWGLYVPVYCRSVQRAGARASAPCIVHNRKVAMLAWELQCSLSGDRWDFQ
eukprot:4440163-Pyramimonas_sp.AAC.1